MMAIRKRVARWVLDLPLVPGFVASRLAGERDAALRENVMLRESLGEYEKLTGELREDVAVAQGMVSRTDLAQLKGRYRLPIVDQDGRSVGLHHVSAEELRRVDAFVDENGTCWVPPTAWAYFAVCRARDKLQADNERLEREGIRLAEMRGLICTGCGTSHHMDDLHDRGALSCCPERKMVKAADVLWQRDDLLRENEGLRNDVMQAERAFEHQRQGNVNLRDLVGKITANLEAHRADNVRLREALKGTASRAHAALALPELVEDAPGCAA